MEQNKEDFIRLKAQKSAFSYIGLAAKAGRLVSGEFSVEKAAKEDKLKLVIIAEDASENTKKKFRNKCEYYNIPFYIFGIKTELGHAMGKEFRASLGFLDENLSEAVKKQLDIVTIRKEE